jgi:hypothetical protein
MKRFFILILSFIFFVQFSATASSDENTEPNEQRISYSRCQYAGNLGLISIGYGRYFFNQRLALDVGYGYLPETVNGAKIHSLFLKSSVRYVHYHIRKLEITGLAGTSITYSILPNTYIRYPDYYPDGYYKPNAIHLLPYIGISAGYPCNFPHVDFVKFYSEMGTTDYDIWQSIQNDYVDYDDIWNLCFGMIFHLRQNL